MAVSVDEYKNKMENTLKIFHEELGRLRPGRATPSLLDPVFVKAYNSKMKISELATVNAPEPKLLTFQFWDKSMVVQWIFYRRRLPVFLPLPKDE